MLTDQVQRTSKFLPAHHNADPVTSKQADDAITASGARMTQALQVLALVKRHTGFTIAELASIASIDCHMIIQHLPELKDHGYITCRDGKNRRECGINHTPAITWWFVKEPDPPK